MRGPRSEFTGLCEELLDRLPRRQEASEQLVRLLTWFKELQERVEAAYLKATGAAKLVENNGKNNAQVMAKTQEMNPREVISEPHILITNQLIPVISNSSEKEEAADVVPNARPEDRVDGELEDWVEEVRNWLVHTSPSPRDRTR